jgi:hypothetical protein
LNANNTDAKILSNVFYKQRFVMAFLTVLTGQTSPFAKNKNLTIQFLLTVTVEKGSGVASMNAYPMISGVLLANKSSHH